MREDIEAVYLSVSFSFISLRLSFWLFLLFWFSSLAVIFLDDDSSVEVCLVWQERKAADVVVVVSLSLAKQRQEDKEVVSSCL